MERGGGEESIYCLIRIVVSVPAEGGGRKGGKKDGRENNLECLCVQVCFSSQNGKKEREKREGKEKSRSICDSSEPSTWTP